MAKWEPVDKHCEDCGILMVGVPPMRRFCPTCAKKRSDKSTAESKDRRREVKVVINPYAKYCDGCYYWRSEYGSKYCNYIFEEDRMRPCPPGKGCTVRKKK